MLVARGTAVAHVAAAGGRNAGTERCVQEDRGRSGVPAFCWRIGGGHASATTHLRLRTFLKESGGRWTSHWVSTMVDAAVRQAAGKWRISLSISRSSADSASTRLTESVYADGSMPQTSRKPTRLWTGFLRIVHVDADERAA